VAGDFDGDHLLDLAVTNDLSNNLSILLGKRRWNLHPAAD
jgi:hypothetical protein